jgi:uncharacterized protein YjbI with pentapeptide repeats
MVSGTSNTLDLFNALTILTEGLDDFLSDVTGSEDWTAVLADRDGARGINGKTYARDAQAGLRMITDRLPISDLVRERLTNIEICYARELREVRNRVSHRARDDVISDDDAYRALDTMQRLLIAFKDLERANSVLSVKLKVFARMAGVVDAEQGVRSDSDVADRLIATSRTQALSDLPKITNDVYSDVFGVRKRAIDTTIGLLRDSRDATARPRCSKLLVEYLRTENSEVAQTADACRPTYTGGEVGLRGQVVRELVNVGALGDTSELPLDLHGVDLRCVDLSGVDLTGVNLTGAKLEGVHFASSKLARSEFRDSFLHFADFGNADLTGAKFSVLGPHLTVGTNFRNSVLVESTFCAAFKECDFSSADFSLADVNYVTFERCDLRAVRMDGARVHGAVYIKNHIDVDVFAGARLQYTNTEGQDVPLTAWKRALSEEYRNEKDDVGLPFTPWDDDDDC